MNGMRKFQIALLALFAATATFAAPPRSRIKHPTRTPRRLPATAPRRDAAASTPRLPQHLERLRGVRPVDDDRLLRQFDQTVELLIELQKRELQIDAEFKREIQDYRTQRRTPIGAQDTRDIEPSHIPAVEVIRSPWS